MIQQPPNTPCGDAAAWQLTADQHADYHLRLGFYHARRSQHLSAQAAVQARRAELGSYFAAAMLVLLLLMVLAGGAL